MITKNFKKLTLTFLIFTSIPSFAVDKVIDGGAGDNNLIINYAGITSYRDFVTKELDDSGAAGIGTGYFGTFTFVDSSDNTIIFENINPDSGLSILGATFDRADPTWSANRSGCSKYDFLTNPLNTQGVLISDDRDIVVTYKELSQSGCAHFNSGRVENSMGQTIVTSNPTGPLAIYGGSYADLIVATVDNDTIYTEAGDDLVMPGDGNDSTYLGAGDDFAFIEIADLTNDLVLDGGDGSDWLSFLSQNGTGYLSNSHQSAVTFDLTSAGNATNFENIEGSFFNDTLTGDTAANTIRGRLGADTVYGGSGNDTIYGEKPSDLSDDYPVNSSGASAGNDTLYGQAGDDTLYGNDGNDTLDGGDGADTLTGGAGIDTFVIRSGDGGDTITDFTDTTDLIGMAGLSYAELSFEQSGNDTLIKKGTETLSIIQNITLDKINYYDIVSTSTDAQNITGTADGDVLLGGSGNDTFTTGAGTDLVLGYAGNDTINIDGAGDKTINGGAGDNNLIINYAGITSYRDFVTKELDDSGAAGIGTGYFGTFTFVDSSDNTIIFENINPDSGLSILGATFDRADPTWSANRSGCSKYDFLTNPLNTQGVLISDDRDIVVTYKELSQSGCAHFNSGRVENSMGQTIVTSNPTGPLAIYGGSYADLIVATVDNDTIYTEAGDDLVMPGDGNDSTYLGAGDDFAFIEIADLTNDLVLDGGDGSDWLSFLSQNGTGYLSNSHQSAVTFDLTSAGNATNFENIEGSFFNDTLTGDTAANTIRGRLGADTVYGGSGNDTIYGEKPSDLSDDYPVNSSGASAGNDTLYGQAGDDTLYGNDGNDTLDGGDGADTLTGGAGIDTFVIRSGDGGDTITDFTDTTDLIGMAGLSYAELSFEQSGNDTLIKKGTETLSIIQNITLDKINYYDIVSTSTDAQNITGTADGDVLLGGSGNDTFTTGAGTDLVLGYAGNDTINIDGAGDKTINGGAGDNNLIINYAGITSYRDFVTKELDDSGAAGIGTGYFGTFTFVDSSDNTIIFENINPDSGLSILGATFDRADPTWSANRSGCSKYDFLTNPLNTQGVLISDDRDIVVTYKELSQSGCAHFNSGRVENSMGQTIVTSNPTGPLAIYGGSYADLIVATVDNDTIYTEAGDDLVMPGDGNDSTYLGAGDDFAFIEIADLTNDLVLDGGDGSDWLSFLSQNGTGYLSNSHQSAVTFDLTSAGNATNFENIEGSFFNDTLTGDTAANTIRGRLGADTVYGGSGNDTIYGEKPSDLSDDYPVNSSGASAGNDTLYGQAGDDTLYGNDGNDTLDGGDGADTLTGGAGIDTFVIRSGDGGSDIADADVITDFDYGSDSDIIGMDGLERSQLTVEQGTGSYSSHVVVKKTDTGEFLIVIQNTSLSSISDADFSAI